MKTSGQELYVKICLYQNITDNIGNTCIFCLGPDQTNASWIYSKSLYFARFNFRYLH